MEYGTALELFHHKDIQHAKELSNGIICSYGNCLFQTNAYGAMKIHVEKTHLNIRTFQCEFCDYAAPKQGTLRYHVRRKHEKQYQQNNNNNNNNNVNQDNDNNVTETKSFLKDELLSYGYMNILIVGEMDFSFSLSIGKILKTMKKINYKLTCTSYIKLKQYNETKVNKKVLANIRNLTNKLNASVLNGVDARYLHLNEYLDNDNSYDLIMFNFPRGSTMTGITNDNTNLLLNFFLSAKQKLLSKNSHKNNRRSAIVILLHTCIIDGIVSDQYIEWNMESLLKQSGLHRIAKYKFINEDFPHYQPRSRLGKAFQVDEAYFHVLVDDNSNNDDDLIKKEEFFHEEVTLYDIQYDEFCCTSFNYRYFLFSVVQ